MNKSNNKISSKLIIGATPPPEIEQQLRIMNGFPIYNELSMQVFEVEVDNTIRYCCWAGGQLLPDQIGMGDVLSNLTPVGQAACLAMLRLPYLYDKEGNPLYALVFHEIKMGKTPLQRKVIAAFRQTADVNAIICFVGDLAKELNGQMGITFNVNGAVEISDIAGMRLPGQ